MDEATFEAAEAAEVAPADLPALGILDEALGVCPYCTHAFERWGEQSCRWHA